MMTSDDVGNSLAEFALASSNGRLPSFYTLSFLNWFGCAVAGARTKPVEAMIRFHASDGAGTVSPPIGRSEMLPASAAVSVDCLSSACLAFDDIHFETTLHPTGPVAAAIYGLARTRTISGRDALEALRVGMEIECRLAAALFGPRSGAAGGWYPTGITGGIGAAAAVGRLLGQDRDKIKISMGLAAAKASGTRGTHGAMSAYWPPAIAAEAGYSAALLAGSGFVGTISALTGKNGLIQQLAPHADLDAALAHLGDRYICETTSSKLYPYGFIAYAPIRCAIDLHEREISRGRVPSSVTLSVSPTCANLGGHALPANPFEAQVALRYIVAKVITDAEMAFEPVPDDFTVEARYADVARRIDLRTDDRLANDQCRMTVEFEDGGNAEFICMAAPGNVKNPISDYDVRAKFLRLVSPIRGEAGALKLLGMIEALDELGDLSSVQ